MGLWRKGILASCLVVVVCCLPAGLEAAWVIDGTAVCTASYTQDMVSMVSNGAGGAFLTWRDQRSPGSYQIYAQHIDADGNTLWSSGGVAVCLSSGYKGAPKVVLDGAGGAIIAWDDERIGGIADIYAQRINASGTALWITDGVAVCAATGPQYRLIVGSDGAGGAIIAWQDLRAGAGLDDIYAQRVNASGTALWAANGVAICAAANQQEHPDLIPDGSGGALIVWQDNRNSATTGYDLYVQRVNSSGTAQWTANGVALCAASLQQNIPRLCTDGAGGAIVAWNDYRSGSQWDVYARRVNAGGTPQWAADGIALCNATLSQLYATIASDGAGGAVVAWQDLRSSNNDIYAQRVNSSGNVLWTANGVAVCTASYDQSYPVITGDGANCLIVAWQDYRTNSHFDIYAQRFESGGVAKWATNGLAVCTATGSQQTPVIAAGKPGTAVIAWNDGRAGNTDIYASATPWCSVSPTTINFGNL